MPSVSEKKTCLVSSRKCDVCVCVKETICVFACVLVYARVWASQSLFMRIFMCLCVCACVCVRVYICVSERDRDSEKICECVGVFVLMCLGVDGVGV